MKGSKYDDEIRERALAMCAQPKMNAGKVAKILGLPRATVYDWQRTAMDTDEDYQAVRRNKLRAMMDRAYSVLGRTMDGLDAHSRAVKLENEQIEKILLKIAGEHEIDEKTRDEIINIVRHYTGVTMPEMTRVAKDVLSIHESLSAQLNGGKEDVQQIQISFADAEIEDMAQ